jgi:hypothetical protein
MHSIIHSSHQVPDDTLVLPIAAVAATYANLELGFGGGSYSSSSHVAKQQSLHSSIFSSSSPPLSLFSLGSRDMCARKEIYRASNDDDADEKNEQQNQRPQGTLLSTTALEDGGVGNGGGERGMAGALKDCIQTLLICSLPLVAT